MNDCRLDLYHHLDRSNAENEQFSTYSRVSNVYLILVGIVLSLYLAQAGPMGNASSLRKRMRSERLFMIYSFSHAFHRINANELDTLACPHERPCQFPLIEILFQQDLDAGSSNPRQTTVTSLFLYRRAHSLYAATMKTH